MLVSVQTLFAVILVVFSRIAMGNVHVTEPEAGSTFDGSSGTVSIDVKWEDDGTSPSMDMFESFTFTLVTGPNGNIQRVRTLEEGVSISDITSDDGTYTYTVEIPAGVVGNGQYYIQVYAAADANSFSNRYSPRFQLVSMQGASSATFSGTGQPGGEVIGFAQSTSIDSRSFTLHYTQQTGISRFAPMQTQPGTQITATSWTRKFPTSAVTYYSTIRGTLAQQTTITPGWSYVLSSGINMATPAPYPTDNGGWRNPQERQSLSTRKVNLKKRQLVTGK